MGDTTDDLSKKLMEAAQKKVGGPALTKTKFGADCFVLVDTLLRSLDANSAADYEEDGRVTPTQDYTWGDGILLDSLRPGDILQFRNHVVDSGTWKQVNGKWMETEGRTQNRPHHTAIVLEIATDGSVTVVEQNVKPDPKKVTRNVIPRLEAGEEERRVSSDVKIKLKVTGSVRAFRPVPRPEKGASLLPPSPTIHRRMLAHRIPSQGGAKRPPGPLGTSSPTASHLWWDDEQDTA